MTDGDAHRRAIKEIQAIVALGGDFAVAVGALIKTRHETIARRSLGSVFERHDRDPGLTFYSVSHCVGFVGTTAVFVLEKDSLRLLSVVAFDNFIDEAMSAGALNKALQLATERI
jgi:hypothetical protein